MSPAKLFWGNLIPFCQSRAILPWCFVSLSFRTSDVLLFKCLTSLLMFLYISLTKLDGLWLYLGLLSAVFRSINPYFLTFYQASLNAYILSGSKTLCLPMYTRTGISYYPMACGEFVHSSVFNFASFLIIFTLSYLSQGFHVYKIMEGLPAYNCGKISVGDKLLEVWTPPP